VCDPKRPAKCTYQRHQHHLPRGLMTLYCYEFRPANFAIFAPERCHHFLVSPVPRTVNRPYRFIATPTSEYQMPYLYPFISICHRQTSRSEISGLRIANRAYSYRTRDLNLSHAPSRWHKKQQNMLVLRLSGSGSPGSTRTRTDSVISRRLID